MKLGRTTQYLVPTIEALLTLSRFTLNATKPDDSYIITDNELYTVLIITTIEVLSLQAKVVKLDVLIYSVGALDRDLIIG